MVKNTIENKEAILQEKSDIEKILQDAYLSSIRKTGEYQFGRFEEKLENEREILKKSFEKIVNIAEAFYLFIKEKFPEVKIKQFRIGIDYSSQIPTAIMLIDKKDKDSVLKIRYSARDFEKISWSHGITECYLWTKIDENIEQELIESDFPFYRKSL
jgi:hypothetical protein